MGTIDNKSVLVQITAWCWTITKPLPEPMLTMYYDAIWATNYGVWENKVPCVSDIKFHAADFGLRLSQTYTVY